MPVAPQLAVPFAVLAVVTGYAAVESSGHASGRGRGRARLWLLLSAMLMALSTWCTHFIGVALLTGRISAGSVAAVVGVSILVVLFTTGLTNQQHGRAASPLIGGALIGSALSGMHGTGVAGVLLARRLEHDSDLVVFATAASIIMAGFAVVLALRLRSGVLAHRQAVAAAAAAERALEESEERFRQVVENIDEVFYMAAADGARLLYVNPAFERVLGRSLDDTPSSPRSLTDMIHPDDRARVVASLEQVAAGEATDITYRLLRGDGSRRWVRDRSYPVPPQRGEPPRVVGIASDVTAEHEAEERLARMNAQLEERVVARTDELAATNRALEEQTRRAREASRLKSEFLANMSHELRTPLNAIIGFAELIHDGRTGPVSESQKEYLGDVLTSARHLLQLINDVLDLSKIEAGKMDFRPEPVNLARIATEVRDILRTVAAQRRIRVTVDVQPVQEPVVVDPSRLKQVLYNYLSNALKFTSEGGSVAIHAAPDGADAFRIEVRDTGIGIADADMGRLFGEFQQLDTGQGKHHAGTGLGLALTKRIVEAQGGTVGVASRLGVGSTFHAVLPCRPQSAGEGPATQRAIGRSPASATPRSVWPAPAGGPAASTLPHSPRRVLVVEDEPADREWLASTLGSAGYVTRTTETGAAAIEICATEHFDAVVLDILLPDMTGWDVLRGIRAAGRNRDVPVLVSTVVKERASSIGFAIHDYLLKPVQAGDLLASLERAGVSPERVDPVLVVDDDHMALRLMYAMLTQLGFQPVCADDGEHALAVAEDVRPSAVVLDLLMPTMDGFEFLERFRSTAVGRTTPVIVWTNKDLTQEEAERLRESAASLASKTSAGSGHVLQELQRHLLRRRPTPGAAGRGTPAEPPLPAEPEGSA